MATENSNGQFPTQYFFCALHTVVPVAPQQTSTMADFLRKAGKTLKGDLRQDIKSAERKARRAVRVVRKDARELKREVEGGVENVEGIVKKGVEIVKKEGAVVEKAVLATKAGQAVSQAVKIQTSKICFIANVLSKHVNEFEPQIQEFINNSVGKAKEQAKVFFDRTQKEVDALERSGALVARELKKAIPARACDLSLVPEAFKKRVNKFEHKVIRGARSFAQQCNTIEKMVGNFDKLLELIIRIIEIKVVRIALTAIIGGREEAIMELLELADDGVDKAKKAITVACRVAKKL